MSWNRPQAGRAAAAADELDTSWRKNLTPAGKCAIIGM
nr:MAG TPA: hypothetical protein [Caudoviricetes sp.]